MLPVRTFFTSVNKNTRINWDEENKNASVLIGEYHILLNAEKNKIEINGENIPVSGKIAIKDGRLFIPIRNWKDIFNTLGYKITDEDIIWNDENKEAVIKITERKVDTKEPNEFILSGKGEEPVYALELSEKYDEIKNIGKGYFVAVKYGEDQPLGTYIGGDDCEYSVIDSNGTVYMNFPPHVVRNLEYIGEGKFCVTTEKHKQYISDIEGNILFNLDDKRIEQFSDGMAAIGNIVGDSYKYGYVDENGNMIVDLQFDEAKRFSEGLAAVAVGETGNKHWGIIDKNGNFVIKPEYYSCGDFCEGLAMVRTNDGVGFINNKGETVIEPVFKTAGNFADGKAFAVTADSGEVWIIDNKGKKLKYIENVRNASVSFSKDGRLFSTEIIIEDLAGADHSHVVRHYDDNGEISYDEYKLKVNLSEGLSPMYDKQSKSYGYTDKTGKFIISPIFDKAEPFLDGYAVVADSLQKADGSEGVKWGIIKNITVK